jgi:flagellar biosynthetic protein FliO
MNKRIGLVTSLITSLLCVFSTGVLRAQQEEVPEIGGDLGPTLLQLLGALLLIVAFIYVSVWLMKRYTNGRINSGGSVITIVERRHLTPKQALYLLKVGEEHLLVGATENGINKICDVKVPESDTTGNQRTKPQESKFGQLLTQAKSSLMPLISTKRKEVEI